MSRGQGRTRNWAFIVYPESAPLNWEKMVDETHIPWVKSPEHNMDCDSNGELKKPHWHVMLFFDSVKDYAQVKEISDMCNGASPEKVNVVSAYFRYLCHLDDPDKFQYSVSDIEYHCGADPADFLKPSASERYQYIGEMMSYIRDNDIIEYSDFSLYCLEYHFDDWYPLLCDSCTYVISEFIKSNRHRKRLPEEVENE